MTAMGERPRQRQNARRLRKDWRWLSLSLLMAVAGCAPAGPVATSAQSPAETSGQSVAPVASAQPRPVSGDLAVGDSAFRARPGRAPAAHRIRFVIQPTGAFRTQQTAQPGYVKLTIVGRDSQGQTQTLAAVGADANGFLAMPANGEAVTAQVPDGNNWVVTAGFYNNPSDDGLILARKAAFHSADGAASTVNVDNRSHLTGAIVEQLRLLGSSLLNQPLDLTGLQAFVDGLTGAPDFSRLNLSSNGTAIPASPRDPTEIDAGLLASQLSNFEINPAQLSLSLGQGLDPKNYKRAPYLNGSFDLDVLTDGVREAPALDTASGTLFFNDTRISSTSVNQNEQLYGVGFANGQFTQRFKVGVGKVLSRYVTTGLANADGHSPTQAVYLTRQLPTGLELVAFNQLNGNLLWSKPFATFVESDNSFTPVAWLDTTPNPAVPCGCDDVDILYTALNAADANLKGVYKIRSSTGVQEGFYRYDGAATSNNFTSTGVLSPDGSKLYVVNNGSSGGSAPAELIVINTATMGGTRVSLAPYAVRPKAAPARGRNGRLYLPVFTASGSYLLALNADGSLRWNLPLATSAARADYPPVVDIKSGKPQIYVHLNDGKLFSIRDDGSSASLSWSKDLKYALRGSPLLGESTQLSPQQKYIYVATQETGQVFGLKESDGSLLWQTSPQGTFSSGFAIRQGHLLVTTRDGNDGTKVGLRALKVEAGRLTSSAPWPRFGGNDGNTGVSSLSDQ